MRIIEVAIFLGICLALFILPVELARRKNEPRCLVLYAVSVAALILWCAIR